MKRKAQARGFTLVELLMVVAILGIVLTAVYSIFSSHQRTAYVDEEVVDVQQNLRIALDSLSRDIRMAGFLIKDTNGSLPNPVVAGGVNPSVPIGAYGNNTGPEQDSLPPPNSGPSDSITMNMLSSSGLFTTITAEVESAVGPGIIIEFPVASVDYFPVGVPVGIYDAANFRLPRDSNQNDINTQYVVKETQTTGNCAAGPAPCMKLEPVGGPGATVIFKTGFVIARVLLGGAVPTQVRYQLVPPDPAGVCITPEFTYCLERQATGEPRQILAMNLAGLQFSYLLDDGTELPNSANPAGPTNLDRIRAVRATIWGQTSETRRLTNNEMKTRQMSTVVKLRNRDNQ